MTPLSQDAKVFKSALSDFVRWSVRTHIAKDMPTHRPRRTMGHGSVASIANEFNAHMENLKENASLLTHDELSRCMNEVIAAMPKEDENYDYAIKRIGVAKEICLPHARAL